MLSLTVCCHLLGVYDVTYLGVDALLFLEVGAVQHHQFWWDLAVFYSINGNERE